MPRFMQLKRTLVSLFILPIAKFKSNEVIHIFLEMSKVENINENNNINYKTNLLQQNLSLEKENSFIRSKYEVKKSYYIYASIHQIILVLLERYQDVICK